MYVCRPKIWLKQSIRRKTRELAAFKRLLEKTCRFAMKWTNECRSRKIPTQFLSRASCYLGNKPKEGGERERKKVKCRKSTQSSRSRNSRVTEGNVHIIIFRNINIPSTYTHKHDRYRCVPPNRQSRYDGFFFHFQSGHTIQTHTRLIRATFFYLFVFEPLLSPPRLVSPHLALAFDIWCDDDRMKSEIKVYLKKNM